MGVIKLLIKNIKKMYLLKQKQYLDTSFVNPGHDITHPLLGRKIPNVAYRGLIVQVIAFGADS